MTGRFGATITVERPIDEVFAFLAESTNDPKFSPRVIDIANTTGGQVGVGTIFVSHGEETDRRSSTSSRGTASVDCWPASP